MKTEELTMEKLVDGCCEIILNQLMKGEFKSGVWSAVDWAVRTGRDWNTEQLKQSLAEHKECPICNRKVKK
jgi:hypothetical protein